MESLSKCCQSDQKSCSWPQCYAASLHVEGCTDSSSRWTARKYILNHSQRQAYSSLKAFQKVCFLIFRIQIVYSLLSLDIEQNSQIQLLLYNNNKFLFKKNNKINMYATNTPGSDSMSVMKPSGNNLAYLVESLAQKMLTLKLEYPGLYFSLLINTCLSSCYINLLCVWLAWASPQVSSPLGIMTK